MNRHAVFAAVTTVLAAIALTILIARPAPTSPAELHEPPSEPVAFSASATLPRANEPHQAADRVAIEQQPARDTGAGLEHPYEFTLHAHIVTLAGLPAIGARPRLAPPSCTLGEALDAADTNGLATVTWRSRVPTGHVLVEGYRGVLHRLSVQVGAPTHVTIVGEVRRGSDHSDGTRMRAGMHPHARFVLDAELMEGLDHLFWHSTACGGGSVEIVDWTGTVHDAAKRACPDITVALLHMDRVETTVQTDRDGQFRVRWPPRGGTVTLRATHPSLGTADQVLRGGYGANDVDLVLDRGVTLCGLALDEHGLPVTDTAVTWTAHDGLAWNCVRTDAHGTFTFANVRGALGTVHLWSGAQHTFPAAMARNVFPGDRNVLLTLHQGSLGALHLTIATAAELSSDVLLRLHHEELAMAIERQVQAGQPIVVDALPAGSYRVALFHRAAGWLDLGRHEVSRRGRVDLGTVRLPEPGRLAVAFAGVAHSPDEPPAPELDANDLAECYAILPELDLRMRLGTICAPFEGRLPAGNYAFLFPPRETGGVPGQLRFSITAGQTMRLDLGPWLPR